MQTQSCTTQLTIDNALKSNKYNTQTKQGIIQVLAKFIGCGEPLQLCNVGTWRWIHLLLALVPSMKVKNFLQ